MHLYTPYRLGALVSDARADQLDLSTRINEPRTCRLPLLAYPLGLKSVDDNPFADCRAIIVLIDPEQKRQSPEGLLRNMFNLTRAEAKLAMRLANGATVEAASDGLGITKSTARNQLKAVFAKMGVHRQAELVSLISATLGPFKRTNDILGRVQHSIF